jgi:hypothetical protein
MEMESCLPIGAKAWWSGDDMKRFVEGCNWKGPVAAAIAMDHDNQVWAGAHKEKFTDVEW